MLIPVAVVLALVVIGSSDGADPTDSPGIAAPMFELPTSTGTTVALDDALRESDVLLYFSMGVGCDGCFAQIPEVDRALADRGISLLPVMVQDASLVQSTAEVWDIRRPILVDTDRSVSEAYGMIGVMGHNDTPFHSIALVEQDGTLAFVKHYDTMFVGVDQMLADLSVVG